MAQANDFIDLTGLMDDVFVEAANMNGTVLELTRTDGEIVTVDLAGSLPDEHVSNVYLTGTDLVFTFEEGKAPITVPLAIFEDTHVTGANFVGASGVIEFAYNNTTPAFTLDISEYVSRTDKYVTGGIYNCISQSYELTMSDGTTVALDFQCLSDLYAASERGGVAYDATKTYTVGDIVTMGTTAYINLTGTSSVPGSITGAWSIVNATERGGLAHDMTVSYQPGDMVTASGLIYLALQANTGDSPLASSGNWAEYNSSFHIATSGGNITAATHDPSISEYPDTTVGERIGAVWTVTNLGEGNTYTYTGGSFIGLTVKDGDRIIWSSGQEATPEFFLDTKAVFSAERGGIAWRSSQEYYVNDIVVDPNGSEYICIADVVANALSPEQDVAHWKIIVRTAIWNSTTTYEEGNLAVIGDKIYIAPAGGVPAGITPPTAPWLLANPTEKGGVPYNASLDYNQGDIVTEGQEVYLSLTGQTTLPSGNPIDWLKLDTSGTVNTSYDNSVTYVDGDIVSYGSDLFIAPPGGVPAGTTPPNAPWILTTPDEVGGITWNPTVQYVPGDIVSLLTSGTQIAYIAKNTNTGVSPDNSTTDWEEVVSATSYLEKGGIEWSPATAYRVGDIATEKSGGYPVSYVCLADNTNNVPSLNLTSFWELVDAPEIGGRDWRDNEVYLEGDIVTDVGVVYRAVQTNTGPLSKPVLDAASWQIVDRSGAAWKATTDYIKGELVTDNGLVYVAIGNTTGDTPATSPTDWKQVKDNNVFDPGASYEEGEMVVVDGDIYIAPSGGVPAGAWDSSLWIAATNEGDLWLTNINYETGAMVSFDDIVYVALTDNISVQPDTDALTWRIVGGAGVHNDARPYFEGDIVSFGSDLYIAPVGGVNAGPFDASEWIAATKEGDLWVANVNYVVGAVVSWNTNTYVAINDSIGSQPSSSNNDWHLHVAHDDYAGETLGGTVKARWDGATNTLYLTNNGTNP